MERESTFEGAEVPTEPGTSSGEVSFDSKSFWKELGAALGMQVVNILSFAIESPLLASWRKRKRLHQVPMGFWSSGSQRLFCSPGQNVPLDGCLLSIMSRRAN